jgi:hypothetical protein
MRNETGIALISVLMVVVVFLLLGMALFQWTAVEALQVQRQEKQLQAYYLARSGLEAALNYVFEQVAQGVSVDKLKLNKLNGSLAEAGSYEVTFSRDAEEGSVEINAKGYVAGPVTAEETIRCTAYLDSPLGRADKAEAIGWGSLSGQHLNLVAAGKDNPLVHDGTVLFKANNQIFTELKDVHYFKADAMEFSSGNNNKGNNNKGNNNKLHFMNKSELHLYTDFVVFKTEVKLHPDSLLTLNVYKNPIIEDNVKYGVVYFSDDAFSGDPKGYFKFKDGITLTWQNGKLQNRADLVPISGAELSKVFSSWIVYSPGT